MHKHVVAFMLPGVLALVYLIACGQHVADVAQNRKAGLLDHFDDITLQRTGCFGPCPIYKVSIQADGTVKYEGIGFAKVKGAATGHISQQQVTELVRAINTADYLSLQNSYQSAEDGCPTNWTDNPSAITSVTVAGQTKTITHNYGCRENDTDDVIGAIYPRELATFESSIDEIVGITRWIGTSDERRHQMNRP